jgi:predicted DNA-binding protein with PD1-like motif
MTINLQRSDSARHFVVQVAAGEIIPDCLLKALQGEGIARGWIRGSGVLADIALRAYDPVLSSLGAARNIEGPLQALLLEGSIGHSSGELNISLRAFLARESEFGLQTISGEVERARALALELFVMALDGLSPQLALAGDGRGAWHGALEASEQADRQPEPRPSPAPSPRLGAPIPARPPPRRDTDLDAPFPEQGDTVEHFAFGRCEVLKSDGDRLHLKVHRDGRVREIALGMLRVSRQTDGEDGRRHFKLERRM